MIIGCNIWMICLELNLIIYDLGRKLQLCKFVWTPVCSSVWVVFNNFLFKDATDRSKIRSKHYRIFVDVSLYHLSLFANTLFKESNLHIKLFVLFSWLYMLVKLIFTFKYSQANLFLVQITKLLGVPINMRIDWRHFIKISNSRDNLMNYNACKRVPNKWCKGWTKSVNNNISG